jgi:hypothetical protein
MCIAKIMMHIEYSTLADQLQGGSVEKR